MLPVLLAAAFSWPLHPLDVVWARLAEEAGTHATAAFIADRAEIDRLDRLELARWGAKQREAYKAPGYTVTTYTGPTRARGERSRSAYFALVVPDGDLQPPTFWEVTPAYSPTGGALWFLTVSGCNLTSGDSVMGRPRSWRTSGIDDPPSYEAFKASLSALAGTTRAFPADTTVSKSVGATCLYVGDIDTQPVFSDSTGP